MNWAAPTWLGAGVVVAALAVVALLARRRHLARLKAAFGAAVLDRVLPHAVLRRRAAAGVATFVGLALVVVALAEPRFDKQIRTVQADGVDLVLIVDLSRSMDARDVEPSRLERARREVADLFRALQGDRVGLVVFAGAAWPRLPLTEDLAAVRLVLSELDSGTFEAQGSALGDAIREAVTLLGRSESGAGKAALILSDGEIHEGDDALTAATEAAEAGVVLYALGIGEQPAPVPLDHGFLSWNDQKVLSTPDDTVLREVARRTGGAYVKSVASPQDVVGLYEGEMRRALRSVTRDAQQREVWRSAFQWPLGVAVVLMLGAAWLGDGRRALAAVAGLLLAALVAPSPAHAGTVAEADGLFRAGRFAEAADQLTELSLQAPDDAALQERLGAARYRAGDFEGAARAYDRAASLRGGDPDDLYNAGNAHWQAGRLEEAAERFGRVLGAEPGHAKAKTNAELLAKELEARRNQPPPPPPKPSPSEGEDENPNGDGEQDQDPSPGGQGDQDPQEGGESDEQRPEGAPDPNAPPDGGGERRPELSEVEPQEGEGEGEPTDARQTQSGGGETSELGDEQTITAGQAERLLDAVEEGGQQIRVTGNPGGKPW